MSGRATPGAGRRDVLRGLAGAAGVGTLAALTGCADDRPRRLVVAAGDERGIYIAFARLLADRVTASTGIAVEVARTEGSVDNVERLRAGRADLGLALADTLGDPPPDGVTAVARVYENYLQLVVRADGPVRRLEDLRGRTVSLGAAGSGAAVTGASLLRSADLPVGDGAERVRVTYAGLATALDQLRRRDVDAVLWSGGIPTPAVSAADEATPLRMLDLADHVERLATSSGFPYAPRRVPPVGYAPAQGDAARTVGVPNLLLARAGLADDLVAPVVDVLARRAAVLLPDYVRGLQYLTPATMIQTSPVPLHPGAVDAYRALHG
ncbi:TAXI family TRAP transporter solute-binding subunit [Phycicoccus sp. BSK3Z-2]|uniref:TAXI family TRAP transporter solute-binding subunit n=1 Tax=Phycicoccus avicenniae TaxID=2828860 RepID=A0A941DAV6_9MICO|nr:TAXI family TRAP transporter solute-binding subunit [Phycicoccus avicenniae]MBR7744731.1 TAXI family TRAP transporter solute-binding subunit [Phycicoccus avicenniae]